MSDREELARLRKLKRLRELEARAQPQETYDPTDGMSTAGKVFAGTGKAFVDGWRGLKQTFNIGDQEELQAEIDQSKQRDAALMDTGAGLTGNILGNVTLAAPTAAVPGANTILGSAALGGLYGGIMPTASDESTLNNVATGALTGGAAQAAARAVPAVAKAVTRPFHQGGRERIVADTLQRVAPNIATPAQSSIPGLKYTLAEATQDPAIATLERGARNLDPIIAGDMGAQEMANVTAARNAIGRVAGDDAAMEAAKQAREAASAPLYDTAKKAVVQSDKRLIKILDRPEVAKAFDEVQRNAANAGRRVRKPTYTPAHKEPFERHGLSGFRDVPERFSNVSGETLHSLKMALDDALKTGPQRGIGAQEAGAIREARDAVLGWIEKNIPEYGQARQAHSAASRPINQMQIGRYLADKLDPALNDFSVDIPNTRASMYANALRAGDDTARKATGFKGATMDVLDPAQRKALDDVGEYFARREGARNLGRAAGTNTAQNLSTGNLFRQIAGPLGIPESWAEAAISKTLMQPLGVAIKPAEAEVQRTLARALMDPDYAMNILNRARPTRTQAAVARVLRRAIPATSTGLGASAAAQ